jgi:hypothetical protein
MRRVVAAALLALFVVSAASACVVREDPEVIARCKDVNETVTATIDSSLDEGLLVRRIHLVESKDEPIVFVSGELVTPRDGTRDDGDIATWTMANTTGTGLAAADENARKRSSIAATARSPRYIDIDGFIESRGCVSHDRPLRPLETR